MRSREGSLTLTERQQGGLALVALVAGIGAAVLAAAAARRISTRGAGRFRAGEGRGEPATVGAARGFNRAAATLAFSVLADSALEHYRGMFFNRAMYTPIAVSSLMMGASLHGWGDRRATSHPARHAIEAAAGLTGLIGTGFHTYNVGKREGGWSWQNLFYAAPIGAPFALTLSGALGVAAELVRDADREQPRLAGLPAGRALSAFTAVGLAGTVGEAGLFHFRGAFQNPAMFIPVTLPPFAAALLGASAAADSPGLRSAARWALRATAFVGVAGVGFHAYGVSRMMGGWRNWSQNLVDGPPLPAPPAFTGLALAGLAALDLAENANG